MVFKKNNFPTLQTSQQTFLLVLFFSPGLFTSHAAAVAKSNPGDLQPNTLSCFAFGSVLPKCCTLKMFTIVFGNGPLGAAVLSITPPPPRPHAARPPAAPAVVTDITSCLNRSLSNVTSVLVDV